MVLNSPSIKKCTPATSAALVAATTVTGLPSTTVVPPGAVSDVSIGAMVSMVVKLLRNF